MTFLNSAKSRSILTATLGFLIPLSVTLPSLASTVTSVDFSSFNEEGNVSSSLNEATLSTENATDRTPFADFLNVNESDLNDPNDPLQALRTNVGALLIGVFLYGFWWETAWVKPSKRKKQNKRKGSTEADPSQQ